MHAKLYFPCLNIPWLQYLFTDVYLFWKHCIDIEINCPVSCICARCGVFLCRTLFHLMLLSHEFVSRQTTFCFLRSHFTEIMAGQKGPTIVSGTTSTTTILCCNKMALVSFSISPWGLLLELAPSSVNAQANRKCAQYEQVQKYPGWCYMAYCISTCMTFLDSQS